MRELTFAGFLKKYVRALSLSDTCGLYALAREAAHDNPRLREPLFLYALYSGKTDVLMQAVKDAELHQAYRKLLAEYDATTMSAALQDARSEIPLSYKKVWQSYVSRRDRPHTDEKTKELLRQRILSAQRQSGVSNYRLYTDLGLNPGNINAWLKHGKSGKVSLDTARTILRYLSLALE